MTQARDAGTRPALSLSYFEQLMGPHGLYQHATGRTPLLTEGYCTDDNARAVFVLLHARPRLTSRERQRQAALLARCWQFITEARTAAGRYYNFRHADGRWLPHEESQDMYARLFRCLLAVLEHDDNTTRRTAAGELLPPLTATVADFTHPRAWAETLVAIGQASETVRSAFDLIPLAERGAAHLRQLWGKNRADDWPWFEPAMTYANGLLPHGLLAARDLVPEPWLLKTLHASTAFLVQTTVNDGLFTPIGSRGWYPRGGTPSHDNEQPIEASVMLDFLVDYQAAFPTALPPTIVAAPYLWFFGANRAHLTLADPTTGASYDGLFLHGPNTNYGAESMLAYLWTEIRLQQSQPPTQAYAAEQRRQLLRRIR